MTGMTQIVLGWSAFLASTLFAPVEWLKNFFLFHPSSTVDGTPAMYELAYEDIRFGGENGTLLHGWYIPGPGDVLFIWFHGNGGNIQHRLDHVHLMHTHVGGSHLLFDYQGYGLSHGRPSIPGIVSDGRAAIRLVQERGWSKGKRLVFFGESLGCAVALALALDRTLEVRPERLILEAPFYSLHAMGQVVLPPLAFLVKDDLNSARLIPRLTVPLLVIHGTRDRLVPFQQGRALYALAPPPKQFYEIPGGEHVGLYRVAGQRYFQTIHAFVADEPSSGTTE